ncbi:hypothetical protein GMJAKD_01440 [Candidatus Electrothrix aarhusensis]
MKQNVYRTGNKKAVILDGAPPDSKHLDSVRNLLTDVLYKHHGDRVQTFTLRDIKFNHCIGCFNCWLKTPGRCIYNDAAADILQAIVNSNTLVFFTPIVFGGYSSELKKILDRCLPILLPFFQKIYGETHHPPRYPSSPRIIGTGVQITPQEEQSNCFKILVGRNAINFHSQHYAAEVVSSMDSPKTLRSRFHAMLSRTDKFPLRKEVSSLIKNTTRGEKISIGNRRALLLVGSPKINNPSTSALLGEHLLKQLKKNGWETESLNINECFKKGESTLCSAIDRADTIVISFPLYIDTLPYQVTKAIEVMASHCNITQTKNFLAIVNNGFPESHQNTVALAICKNFALECGMTWVGGLAMGAGEGLLSGQPAAGFKGLKGLKRPPLYYVNRVLNVTAKALTEGYPVPEKAVQLIAKNPIPLISFDLWRWVFIKLGKKTWEKEAMKNGLLKKTMFDKPYEK